MNTRDLPRHLFAPFSMRPFLPLRGSRVVIKALRSFAHNASPDKTLERSKRTMILPSHKTNRVADSVGATSPANAMDVVFGMHRKVIIHDV